MGGIARTYNRFGIDPLSRAAGIEPKGWASGVTGALGMGGKGGSAPVPDYTGAARQQGLMNTETAIAEALLNRAEEVTPYGSRRWTQTGAYGLPSGMNVPLLRSDIALSPLGQERFGQEERIIGQVGNIAERGVGRVGEAMERPFSVSGVDQLQNKAEEAYFARLDPRLARAREARETELITRGHAPGGRAWETTQQDIGQQENDARRQGILASMAMRPQTLQEELAIRGVPLNELNALRSGSQVQIPQFGGVPGATIAPADYQGAAAMQGRDAMSQYAAEQARAAGNTAGLFGIAGATAPYWWPALFSDRRLKSNVRPIGTFKGYPFYEYTIFGRRSRGVMADEVPMNVVVVHPSGYLMVDYRRL